MHTVVIDNYVRQLVHGVLETSVRLGYILDEDGDTLLEGFEMQDLERGEYSFEQAKRELRVVLAPAVALAGDVCGKYHPVELGTDAVLRTYGGADGGSLPDFPEAEAVLETIVQAVRGMEFDFWLVDDVLHVEVW